MTRSDPSRKALIPNAIRWRRLLFAGCTAACFALPATTLGSADEGKQPVEDRPAIHVREIFVPEGEWTALLENRPERVFLSREEYDGLLAKARKTPPPAAAPRPWALTDAEYELRFDRDRAWIEGTLHLRLLADGLHAIPLPMRGAVIHLARMDGQPAALSLVQEKGAPTAIELFAEGVGEHTFTFTAAAALQVSSVQQSLTFQLPQSASCRTRAVVPGDVELKSGAVVLERRLEASGETRFDLVLPADETTLVLTLNSRLRQNRRLVHARSVNVVEVGEASRRICGEIAFDVLDQPVSSLEVSIPDGYTVTAVDCPAAAKWQERHGDERRELILALREPATGRITARIQGVQTAADDPDVPIALFQPLNVTTHAAVAGLLLDANLRVKDLSEAGVVRIDGSAVAAVLAPLTETAEGASRGRLIAAWYAPWGNPEITARVERPRPQLDALMNLVLTVKETELSLLGEVFLTPLEERLYEAVLIRPADWHVMRVTLPDGTALRFENFGRLDEEGRVVIRLPQGIAVGEQTRVDFQAVSMVPARSWDEPGEVVFPAFRVASATRERGAAALTTGTDLEARPMLLDRLAPLNAADRKEFGLTAVETALAYRVVEQPFSARFQILKAKPRLSAELFQCFRLETVALHAHVELAYRVEGAGEDTFSFSLPLFAPEGVRVVAGEGKAVKQVSHEVRGERRYWTVRLQEPAVGAVRLIAEWRQERQSGGDEPAPLPLAACENVVYQTGIVSLEATSELEVDLLGEARRVDEGELAAAEYQPGPGLLAVMSYGGEPPPLRIQERRHEVLETPPLLIQRAILRTQVDAGGALVGQADFFLLTGGASLRLELPRDGELWSALLDDRPVRVRRVEKESWLDIPAGDLHTIRHLRLVYGQRFSGFRFWAATELRSVWFSVAAAPGRAPQEPACTDLDWKVLLPPGFAVVGSRGNVLRLQADPAPILLSALKMFDLAYLGPGCGIHAARESAHRRFPMEDTVDVNGAVDGAMNKPAVPQTESAVKEELAADGREAAVLSEADTGMGQAQAHLDAAPGMQDATPRPEEQPPTAAMPGAPPRDVGPQGTQVPVQVPTKRRMQVGFGHLPMALQIPDGYQVVTLSNLGSRPTVRLTLVRSHDVFALAAVLLGGMAAVYFKMRAARKGGHGHGPLLTLLAAASLIPLIPGLEFMTETGNRFFLGVVGAWSAWFLLPPIAAAYIYCRNNLAGAYVWMRRALTKLPRGSSSAKAGIVMAMALLVPGQGGHAVAQQDDTKETAVVATDPSGRLTVRILDAEPPLNPPDDAVIIPYDPAEGWHSPGRRVLIPLAKYLELWKAVESSGPVAAQPARPFAVGGVAYQGSLDSADVLRLQGGFEVFVYAAEPVRIPLLFGNASPIAVRLDGRPAALEPGTPGAASESPAQIAAPQVSGDPVTPMEVFLHVAGKGRHRVDIEVLVPLQRTGGLRKADAVLPCPAPGVLKLAVPQAGSEVSFPAGTGRLRTVTAEADASIEGTLLPPGNLSLQWRPQVFEAVVDPSLSATSFVVVDVREEDLLCHWATTLRFRQGERQSFEFLVPADWEIEQIEGENVKSWDMTEAAGKRGVTVTLLAAARTAEKIVLHLRRPLLQAGETEAEFEAPNLTVPGAASHGGRIIVRRSPYLEVTATEAESLAVAALPDQAEYVPAVGNARVSPLGVQPQIAYSFFSEAHRLRLRARVREGGQSAVVQAVFRVGSFRRSLEARIIWRVANRPFYQGTVLLPGRIHRIDQVELPGEGTWDIQAAEDRTRLNIFLKDGILGDVPVVIRATLSVDDLPAELSVPAIEVPGVRSLQGEMAVSVEPRYSLELRSTRDCLPVLVSRLAWLPEDRRTLTPLALEFGNAPLEAVIGLRSRTPVVACETVGNVRFTDRAVEETVLLELSVEQAGIRGLRFRLPSGMRDCRIQAPMLRSKSITPCEDGPDSDVWVNIEFQDELMGLLRILVEQDFPVTDSPHRASVPTEIVVPDGPPVRMGIQAVTLQNAGRDEVVVAESEDVEPAGTQRRAQLEERLRGPDGPALRLTDAYIIRAGAKNPRLAFRPRTRATQRGGGIRIRLADALLTLDGNGDYRGEQQYWIENRQEQFLRIRLPDGARLWSASVDGRPAKPIGANEAADASSVRIPVPRTAEGDLPLKVSVKYGGSDWSIGWQRRKALPLLGTPDGTPEWSQLRVHSSDDRLLFDFGGTARPVPERELASGYEGFRQKLAADLVETLKQGDDYARVRAGLNLRILGSSVAGRPYAEESEGYGILGYGGYPGSGLPSSAGELVEALEQAERGDASNRSLNNRTLLGSLYENQQAISVREGADDAVAAFPGQISTDKERGGGASFDQSWFQTPPGAAKAVPKGAAQAESAAERKKAPALSTAPSRQLQSRFEFGDRKESEQLERRSGAVQTREGRATPGVPADDSSALGLQAADEAARRYGERYQMRQRGLYESQEAGRRTAAGDALEQKPAAWAIDGSAAGLPPGDSAKTDAPASGAAVGLGQQGRPTPDVAIPTRGKLYCFVAPQGEMQVHVRAVPADTVTRLRQAALVLILMAGLAVVLWISRRAWKYLTQHRELAFSISAASLVLVCFTGVLGLLLLWVSIYAFAAGAAGIRQETQSPA